MYIYNERARQLRNVKTFSRKPLSVEAHICVIIFDTHKYWTQYSRPGIHISMKNSDHGEKECVEEKYKRRKKIVVSRFLCVDTRPCCLCLIEFRDFDNELSCSTTPGLIFM